MVAGAAAHMVMRRAWGAMSGEKRKFSRAMLKGQINRMGGCPHCLVSAAGIAAIKKFYLILAMADA